MNAEAPDRNLALELVRVTEAAALAAVAGSDAAKKADGAAVDAMRLVLDTVRMNGTVVIGEGRRTRRRCSTTASRSATATGPAVDVAVDPLEGTRLTALGQPNAIAVIAVAERGTMFDPGGAFYMDKIAVGPEAADAIDINAPPGTTSVRSRRQGSRCRSPSSSSSATGTRSLIRELGDRRAREPDPRR